MLDVEGGSCGTCPWHCNFIPRITCDVSFSKRLTWSVLDALVSDVLVQMAYV